MNVEEYLVRIGFAAGSRPDAASLVALHRAHMRAVPFENLDIHRKRALVLDEAQLFDKIVRARRGGICYELNGLFAALLREQPVRLADAIQLAAAERLPRPLRYVTFDPVQIPVALGLSFDVRSTRA